VLHVLEVLLALRMGAVLYRRRGCCKREQCHLAKVAPPCHTQGSFAWRAPCCRPPAGASGLNSRGTLTQQRLLYACRHGRRSHKGSSSPQHSASSAAAPTGDWVAGSWSLPQASNSSVRSMPKEESGPAQRCCNVCDCNVAQQCLCGSQGKVR